MVRICCQEMTSFITDIPGVPPGVIQKIAEKMMKAGGLPGASLTVARGAEGPFRMLPAGKRMCRASACGTRHTKAP